jgi:hypothetical protein
MCTFSKGTWCVADEARLWKVEQLRTMLRRLEVAANPMG